MTQSPTKQEIDATNQQNWLGFITLYRHWLPSVETQAAFDHRTAGMQPEQVVHQIMQWSIIGSVLDINSGRAGIMHPLQIQDNLVKQTLP